MKISKEFKVGLIAIVALLLLYWGFNYLKGGNVFNKEVSFYAVYDRVDGLNAANQVVINGYSVGQVERIYFHPDNSGRLIVKFKMEKDFAFAANTVASINSSDLLGDRTIELLLGDSPAMAENGDTLISSLEMGIAEQVSQQVAPLRKKAETLLGSIDTVLILVSGFLNEQTSDNFVETFNSVRRSFQRLEQTVISVDQTVQATEGDLKNTIHNVSAISNTLEESRGDLQGVLKNINTITDSLSRVRFVETFESLNRALAATEDVMAKINDGEGTAGKLINDPELYNKLTKASDDLDRLLLDVKYNPKRYLDLSLFGRDREYSEKEIREMEREKQKEQDKP